MAKVVYHNINLEGTVFEVLSRNKDGTVNIGTVDTETKTQTVLVKGVQVLKEPKDGCAIVADEPEEKTKK